MTGANSLMGKPSGRFDGHAHIFRADLPMVKDRRYTPAVDATLSDYADLLRAHDLSGGLLVQTSFLGTDNSFLLETLEEAKQYPDLAFGGVAVLQPDTDERELDRLLKAGVVGIRLNLFGPAELPDFDRWTKLFKKVDSLGWHVEVQCEGRKLEHVITEVLKSCQTVVIDHFGLPDQLSNQQCAGLSAVLRLEARRTFVKASAPYRIFPKVSSGKAAELSTSVFKKLFDHLGPDQMLWASDWPWTQFEGEQTFAETLEWQENWLASIDN